MGGRSKISINASRSPSLLLRPELLRILFEKGPNENVLNVCGVKGLCRSRLQWERSGCSKRRSRSPVASFPIRSDRLFLRVQSPRLVVTAFVGVAADAEKREFGITNETP